MKVKSGIVAKVYSIALSPMAILSSAKDRSMLSRMIQMARKLTIPSAIGI